MWVPFRQATPMMTTLGAPDWRDPYRPVRDIHAHDPAPLRDATSRPSRRHAGIVPPSGSARVVDHRTVEGMS